MEIFKIGYNLSLKVNGDGTADVGLNLGDSFKSFATVPAKGSVALEVHGKTATLHNAPGGTVFGPVEELTAMFEEIK